jgi:Zn-dependent protease
LEDLLPRVIVVAIMLLIGFPVHEFAHALAAYRLGDSTAKFMGRLTLNPVAHFDPLGGILLAVTFIGAAAGPISNLVLAIAAAIPLRYILANPGLAREIPAIVLQVLVLFILINIVLMVFNLFPIPPLDGSKVLFAFLPPQVAWRWRPMLEQYGFILLLIIFFLPPGDSIGGRVLFPIIDGILSFLVGR